MNIRTEDGYSLVDLLIALAILSIITNGIMMAIFQIYNVASTRTNHIIAIREVQNAGRWLTLDGQKAASVTPAEDPDGFPLTVSWNGSDGSQHEVVYTLLGSTLQRQHYTNRAVNPEPDTATSVARFIDTSSTSCTVSGNNELVAQITAAVNIYHGTRSETRAYRIFPRPSLQCQN